MLAEAQVFVSRVYHQVADKLQHSQPADKPNNALTPAPFMIFKKNYQWCDKTRLQKVWVKHGGLP